MKDFEKLKTEYRDAILWANEDKQIDYFNSLVDFVEQLYNKSMEDKNEPLS